MTDLIGLLTWLQTAIQPTARHLEPLGAGMFSQAYRFETDDGAFVLRIGLTREAFEKDKLAYERLGHVVRIPRIDLIGSYSDGRFYCISEWQPGRILNGLSPDETRRLLPSLFNNLLAMSRIPVPSEIGFGILNGTGQARRQYATWAECIGAVDDFPLLFTPRGDEVYKPWNELVETTVLDKALVQDARQRLDDLLPYLPNERCYVHGDFGFDNALAERDQLTAILDWAELRCGDWLYDLAYVAYHDEQRIDYVGAFRQWADATGLIIANLTERIRVYSLSIFLGNVFLNANRGRWDWYENDVTRYGQLIG